jgi:LytS/YehU family sensor histidine kinase
LSSYYLFKNKYLQYSIAVAVFIAVMYIIIAGLFDKMAPYHLINDVDHNGELSIPFFTFMILVLVGASAAFKLFGQWLNDTSRINELEKSKTVAELEQLKNQINPHFLFNMLNNANVLTKKDPEKASTVLMGLSDLLRYQLYDSTRDSVLLTADIHFLQDFLSLEKIRRNDFDFVISKEGKVNGVLIAPLLFITFVENAVKHNNDTQNNSFVNLFFEVNDDLLLFKCINSIPVVKPLKQAAGGLGLTNVKRRLNLLYPSKHELIIEEDEHLYSVTLKIKL